MSAQRKPTPEEVESRRYLDPASKRWVVKVMPGAHHISQPGSDELIATVLGSCVAACMYDPLTGIGGMNHFMLPHDDEGDWGGVSLALRYGNHAMETLINDLLKAGANKKHLLCKFFGGGNVINNMKGVGDQNADFAREFAESERLNVAAMDLGGTRGRRIVFDPATGQAWRRLLRNRDTSGVLNAERKLRAAPPLRKADTSIELFD